MSKWKYLTLGGSAGLLFGFIICDITHRIDDNTIPNTEQVQAGYAIPNKLEIKLDDLDRSGEKEVLLNYDRDSYLLRLDEQGKPVIQAYEIKVVPKTE